MIKPKSAREQDRSPTQCRELYWTAQPSVNSCIWSTLALSLATSLCSSGVVTTPLFSSCFLVLGLLTKLSRTAAFLAGEAGRVVFTLSVARFFYVLFGNAAPLPRISSTLLSCLRLSRYFRTLSLVCSLIKALFAWTESRIDRLFFFIWSLSWSRLSSRLVLEGRVGSSRFSLFSCSLLSWAAFLREIRILSFDIVSSIHTLDLLSLRVTNRTCLKVLFIATCYF